uniref:Thymosin beta n=1 Tax=Strongyloides stercoralis TaxID=6248 RepID=A0A0K0EQS8_STRER
MTSTYKDSPKLPVDITNDLLHGRELKHVSTEEKIVLPTADDVKTEKQHEQFVNGIEKFPKNQLHKVETADKTVLPSASDIAIEKVPTEAANFNIDKLNHVEPNVKNVLPSKEQYTREKCLKQAASFDHEKLNHVEPVVKNDVITVVDKQ